MKTQRERDAEKRAEKLKEIDEAVDNGKLVIRQMTPEERKKIGPPREPKPRRQRG
jgi:hypothetical protein